MQGSTERQIKKRYRELSMIYHPDRNPDSEDTFVRIAKAYQAYVDRRAAAPPAAGHAAFVRQAADRPQLPSPLLFLNSRLTDPATRKNWEEFGNPDGPVSRSYGIALPAWIVEKENKAAVLAVYGMLFMILLPVCVVRTQDPTQASARHRR